MEKLYHTKNLVENLKGLTMGGNIDFNLKHNNANKDAKVFSTQRDLVAGEVSKYMALNFILPEHIAKAHLEGDIHYHDLDYAPFFGMQNCMLIDAAYLFKNGFKMGNAEIETPKSIGTATTILSQIISGVSSLQYGGSSINRVDEVLAPYVTKTYKKNLAFFKSECSLDNEKAAVIATKKTQKDTYDAMQSLEYQINTLHTSNGQSPFCTLGFGLGTSWEAKLIQECILKVREEGLGKSQITAVFPKLLYTLKEGHNLKQGDPFYDVKKLAIRCASKRVYPDILNYDQIVEVTGGFKASMGCRSFLSEWVDPTTNESVYDGRMNMGVVSLNLPRIAIGAEGSEQKFWSILADRVLLAKEALDTRIERLKQTKASAAPLLYMEGACGVKLKEDDSVFEVMKDGRATISLGYIGLEETVQALFPDSDLLEDHSAKEFTLKVVAYLSDVCSQWKEEENIAYSLYSTPSESLCDRFCRLDKEKFGEIKGVTDHGYYTNSFHLDVRKETSPFNKIDFEACYPEYASGGFISYVELPRVQNHYQEMMVETLWDYSYNKTPYLGVNIPIDVCHDCGYQGESLASEKGYVCKHCGSDNIEVTKRVCGYLSSPNNRPFNDGKQKEVISRIKHT